MATENTYHSQIDSYLLGTLDHKRRIAFEARLLEDPELKQAVQDTQELFKGINQVEKEELLARLDKLGVDIEQEQVLELPAPKASIIPFNNLLKIAAVILIIVLPSWWYYHQSTQNDRLFAEHFSPYENVITVRGDLGSEFSAAITSYSSREYEASIKRFEEILQQKPDHVPALFYAGNAYLASGVSDKAIDRFQEVIKLDGKFVFQAKWYLALANLKQGNTEKAQLILEDIKASDSPYQQQAELILPHLN